MSARSLGEGTPKDYKKLPPPKRQLTILDNNNSSPHHQEPSSGLHAATMRSTALSSIKKQRGQFSALHHNYFLSQQRQKKMVKIKIRQQHVDKTTLGKKQKVDNAEEKPLDGLIGLIAGQQSSRSQSKGEQLRLSRLHQESRESAQTREKEESLLQRIESLSNQAIQNVVELSWEARKEADRSVFRTNGIEAFENVSEQQARSLRSGDLFRYVEESKAAEMEAKHADRSRILGQGAKGKDQTDQLVRRGKATQGADLGDFNFIPRSLKMKELRLHPLSIMQKSNNQAAKSASILPTRFLDELGNEDSGTGKHAAGAESSKKEKQHGASSTLVVLSRRKKNPLDTKDGAPTTSQSDVVPSVPSREQPETRKHAIETAYCRDISSPARRIPLCPSSLTSTQPKMYGSQNSKSIRRPVELVPPDFSTRTPHGLVEQRVRLRKIEELESIKLEVEHRVKEMAQSMLNHEKQREPDPGSSYSSANADQYHQLIDQLNLLSVDPQQPLLSPAARLSEQLLKNRKKLMNPQYKLAPPKINERRLPSNEQMHMFMQNLATLEEVQRGLIELKKDAVALRHGADFQHQLINQSSLYRSVPLESKSRFQRLAHGATSKEPAGAQWRDKREQSASRLKPSFKNAQNTRTALNRKFVLNNAQSRLRGESDAAMQQTNAQQSARFLAQDPMVRHAWWNDSHRSIDELLSTAAYREIIQKKELDQLDRAGDEVAKYLPREFEANFGLFGITQYNTSRELQQQFDRISYQGADNPYSLHTQQIPLRNTGHAVSSSTMTMRKLDSNKQLTIQVNQVGEGNRSLEVVSTKKQSHKSFPHLDAPKERSGEKDDEDGNANSKASIQQQTNKTERQKSRQRSNEDVSGVDSPTTNYINPQAHEMASNQMPVINEKSEMATPAPVPAVAQHYSVLNQQPVPMTSQRQKSSHVYRTIDERQRSERALSLGKKLQIKIQDIFQEEPVDPKAQALKQNVATSIFRIGSQKKSAIKKSLEQINGNTTNNDKSKSPASPSKYFSISHSEPSIFESGDHQNTMTGLFVNRQVSEIQTGTVFSKTCDFKTPRIRNVNTLHPKGHLQQQNRNATKQTPSSKRRNNIPKRDILQKNGLTAAADLRQSRTQKDAYINWQHANRLNTTKISSKLSSNQPAMPRKDGRPTENQNSFEHLSTNKLRARHSKEKEHDFNEDLDVVKQGQAQANDLQPRMKYNQVPSSLARREAPDPAPNSSSMSSLKNHGTVIGFSHAYLGKNMYYDNDERAHEDSHRAQFNSLNSRSDLNPIESPMNELDFQQMKESSEVSHALFKPTRSMEMLSNDARLGSSDMGNLHLNPLSQSTIQQQHTPRQCILTKIHGRDARWSFERARKLKTLEDKINKILVIKKAAQQNVKENGEDFLLKDDDSLQQSKNKGSRPRSPDPLELIVNSQREYQRQQPPGAADETRRQGGSAHSSHQEAPSPRQQLGGSGRRTGQKHSEVDKTNQGRQYDSQHKRGNWKAFENNSSIDQQAHWSLDSREKAHGRQHIKDDEQEKDRHQQEQLQKILQISRKEAHAQSRSSSPSKSKTRKYLRPDLHHRIQRNVKKQKIDRSTGTVERPVHTNSNASIDTAQMSKDASRAEPAVADIEASMSHDAEQIKSEGNGKADHGRPLAKAKENPKKLATIESLQDEHSPQPIQQVNISQRNNADGGAFRTISKLVGDHQDPTAMQKLARPHTQERAAKSKRGQPAPEFKQIKSNYVILQIMDQQHSSNDTSMVKDPPSSLSLSPAQRRPRLPGLTSKYSRADSSCAHPHHELLQRACVRDTSSLGASQCQLASDSVGYEDKQFRPTRSMYLRKQQKASMLSCRHNPRINEYRNYVHLQGQSYADFARLNNSLGPPSSNADLVNERTMDFQNHSNLLHSRVVADAATSPCSHRNSQRFLFTRMLLEEQQDQRPAHIINISDRTRLNGRQVVIEEQPSRGASRGQATSKANARASRGHEHIGDPRAAARAQQPREKQNGLTNSCNRQLGSNQSIRVKSKLRMAPKAIQMSSVQQFVSKNISYREKFDF